MTRKTIPLRLEKKVYDALSLLSKIKKKSMNELVSNSVEKLLVSEATQTIAEMEEVISKLKSYLADDPKFEKALGRFVEAELAYPDPLEGTIVIDDQSSVLDDVGALLANA